MKYYWFAALLILVLSSCDKKQTVKKITLDTVAYKIEIDKWHAQRTANLKAPNGWLNLIGLHWLNEGMNTFGSGANNDIIFPEGKFPERGGYFTLKQNTVTLTVAENVNIMYEGKPVKSLMVYHPDSTRQPVVEFDSLRWSIIKRDNRFGIRLRDLNHTDLMTFKEIERYPLNAQWRVGARLEKADTAKTIDITNVLGQTTAQKSAGTLVMQVLGKEVRLDALDQGGDELFIIFSDATTGSETYGAGRFIYVPLPDENGNTIIDFNKAYNPPCAFTPYATCPLPPKQNKLDISVTAGEKNYGDFNQLRHSLPN